MPANLYSNYERELHKNVEEYLRENPGKRAEHTAWDFYGFVWFDGTAWHEEVWRYGSPRKTITGTSAEQVIRQACEEFGND